MKTMTAVRRVAATGMGLVLAVAVTVAPARAENLSDALAGAYRTSGLLDQQRALLRVADEDVAIALAGLRPIISWSISATKTLSDFGGIETDDTTSAAGISLQQMIWDAGASKLSIKAAQELVLSTRETLRSVEQRVLLSGVRAYLDVVRTEELVTLRENARRVLAEELRASKDRFDVGEVTRTDVALSESRLANAEAELAAARGDLIDAQSVYVQIVGRMPGTLSRTPTLPKAPASINAAQSVASTNHPDILALQRRVAADEIGIKRAEAAMMPQVDLNVSVGLNNTLSVYSGSDSVSATVRMSQPIYQGGALSARLRRAFATRDATRGSLLDTQKSVLQGVAGAYADLEAARARIVATRERVRAAQVAFDGVREEARLGARTTLDVLNSEQELLDARSALISAQIDRYLQSYSLLSSQGLLTARRLGLNVPIYDEEAYYNQVKSGPALKSKQGQALDRVLRGLGKE